VSANSPLFRKWARYIAHCARFAVGYRPESPSQSHGGVVDSALVLQPYFGIWAGQQPGGGEFSWGITGV
jgi:hypothetical protein